MTLRARVHSFLDPSPDDPLPERLFNLAMVGLIIANVVAVCLESMPGFMIENAYGFVLFEAFSITVFTIELFLRIWSCVEDPTYAGRFGRLRFAFSPLTLLDFAAIVPFYLAFFGIPLDLRFARVVRILRVIVLLRLVRYVDSLRTLAAVFHRQREELMVTGMVGLVVLVLASGIMFHLEHDAQPRVFSSIPATMWWGIVTLTTVGYGDTYPVTPLGRAFGGLVAMIGLGLFALPAGIIASGFAEELRSRREARREPPRCPHCGKEVSRTP